MQVGEHRQRRHVRNFLAAELEHLQMGEGGQRRGIRNPRALERELGDGIYGPKQRRGLLQDFLWRPIRKDGSVPFAGLRGGDRDVQRLKLFPLAKAHLQIRNVAPGADRADQESDAGSDGVAPVSPKRASGLAAIDPL